MDVSERRFYEAMEGLNAACDRLRGLVKTTHREKVFVAVAECLLWVYFLNDSVFWNTCERSKYESYREGNPYGKMVLGMRYAFNMIKHGVDIAVVDLTQSTTLGQFGAAMFGEAMYNDRRIADIRWEDFDHLPTSKQPAKPEEARSYRDYLQHRSVLDTLEKVREFYLKAREHCNKTVP